MAPHHSIPNMNVKRYSGDDTWGVAPWENSTMPKLIFNKLNTPNSVFILVLLIVRQVLITKKLTRL
jgi:hypothetical protein